MGVLVEEESSPVTHVLKTLEDIWMAPARCGSRPQSLWTHIWSGDESQMEHLCRDCANAAPASKSVLGYGDFLLQP